MEARVLSCKITEFDDKKNPGAKVVGYILAVALPGNNGWVEVWANKEYAYGDVVNLDIVEGKYHKAKVRVV